MKRSELVITHNYEGRVLLEIALELYLRQFSDVTIREAHINSAISRAVRTLNRIKNLSSGCDVEYNVDRLPQLGNGVTKTEWVDRNPR